METKAGRHTHTHRSFFNVFVSRFAFIETDIDGKNREDNRKMICRESYMDPSPEGILAYNEA